MRTLAAAVAIFAGAMAARAAVGPPIPFPAAGPRVVQGTVALTTSGNGWAAAWSTPHGGYSHASIDANGTPSGASVIRSAPDVFDRRPAIASNGDVDVVVTNGFQPERMYSDVYRGITRTATHIIAGTFFSPSIASDGDVFLIVAATPNDVRGLFLNHDGEPVSESFAIASVRSNATSVASNGTSWLVFTLGAALQTFRVTRGGVVAN